MSKHLRSGIAVALVCTSIVSAGTLMLNTRFVDRLGLGLAVFLLAPVIGGGVVGLVVGHWIRRLAEVGSTEAPVRAYEFLWASLAGFLVFFATLAASPPFLGIYSRSEFVRYGGALIVAFVLAYFSAIIVRHASRRTRSWIWPVLFAFPFVAVVSGGTLWGRGQGTGSRVLMVAVPGLSWNVAESMIESGRMPNLERLRAGGAWGTVDTVHPLHAPVVWTSVATGKTADKHGVTTFSATASDIEATRIWEILEERGWSVGLFGWPLTWPPEPGDGFTVPATSDLGPDTKPGDLRFIRELAISEKTRRKRTWGRYCRYAFLSIHYGARLSTLLEAGTELLDDPLHRRDLDAARLFTKRKLRAKLDSDYFVELRRKHPVDFASYYTNIVHVAQRYFWKYHEPTAFEGISPDDIARYGASVQDSYRIVDEFLGKILRDTTENDLVVVVSDHGAVAMRADERRTLTLRVARVLDEMRLRRLIEATNVGALTYFRMRPGKDGNPERIRRLFETARLDHGGLPAFDARIDEWGNVIVSVKPSVIDHMDDMVLFQGGRCAVSDLVRSVEFQESADMQETGALVLNGLGIEPGTTFTDASLLDLVPTLLVLNRLDLAADLDGNLIESALTTDVRDRFPGMVATYEKR